LQVIAEEKLTENALRLGDKFRRELKELQNKHRFITSIRGKGLLNAIVIEPEGKKTAWDLCLLLKDNGLLAKTTHDHVIRFAPPLVITETQMDECIGILSRSLEQYAELKN